MTLPRIVITPGEPAGIGPDVLIQIAQQPFAADLIAIADPRLLQERASQLQLSLQLQTADLTLPSSLHQPGTLKIIPIALSADVIPGKLQQDNAQYVVNTLELATRLCLEKKVSALVTGPVHKAHLNQSGIPFVGHTEFLAERCHCNKAVMLFVVDQIKVAILTIHIPLANVPAQVTQDNLMETLRIVDNDLKEKFRIPSPKILVSGLNPHAGENGYLGREEIDIIAPTIQRLRQENRDIIGPLPADTIFTQELLQSADAILAMYHDQALPVIKYMGFDRAINVTLGLPIIRTSVDHGTALSLAGTGKAHPGSLNAAIQLAIDLSR